MPLLQFDVRQAIESDVDGILTLLGRVADEGLWLLTPSSADFALRRARFLETIARGNAGMFVAVAESEIVGEIGMYPLAEGLQSIGMAVAATWRRRGVGSALLSCGIDWARASGAHKVVLEVFPHNTAAIVLYEKFGFAREGYRKDHYRRQNGELWDVISMGLSLV